MDGSSADRIGARSLLALAILSGTVLGAQIVVSRLLASTLGYYFGFMLVSLAMLGLGSGALVVQGRLRSFARERLGLHAAVLSMLASLSAWAGGLAYLQVYAPQDRSALLGWLAPLFFVLFPLFLFSGIAVSLVLCHARRSFHRAYAVDLAGAALGTVGSVALLSRLSPMSALLQVVAVLPAVAGALFAWEERRRWTACAAAACAAALLGLGTWAARGEQIAHPPHIDRLQRPREYVASNSFSSISVFIGEFFSWGLSETYRGPRVPMLDLMIDGIGGTQLARFDGDRRSLPRYEYLDQDLTALGQELVPVQGRQLVIGPGAGVDLLQAVRRGRTDVTAVEINPLMVSTVNDALAPFSGSPYRLPGVRVFVENGRTFVQRTSESWDLISLTWVDTGGSATALAASENYLYTVEAYEAFLRHLAPGGYFAFMRALGERGYDRPVDTLRGLSVTVEALARLGIERPQDHVLVAAVESPFFYRRGMCYVLVKRTPFTAGEVRRAREFLERLRFRVVHLPGDESAASPVAHGARPVVAVAHDILTSPDRAGVYAAAPIDVQPTTDDNPFYFVERAGPGRNAGEGIRLLCVCFGILAALLAVFIGLPARRLVGRARAVDARGAGFLAYCCLVGCAFMLVEIELFQLFALLLGSPTYALATVLGSLLVFTAAGSLAAPAVARRGRGAIALGFAGLVICLALLLAGKSALLSTLLPLPFAARVAATALLIAPLAFHMGLPMALGVRTVADEPGWMMWGWALNGACSVLASVGAILLAIHAGIRATFALGLLCYLAAGALLLLLPAAARQAEGIPEAAAAA